MGLSPLQYRYLALGGFIMISGILIGFSVYQAYFSNPIEYMPEFIEIEEFTLPSSTGNNYTFIPSAQEVTIVNFMYTKCPGDVGCSLLTSNMASLENRIKSRGWTNIQLISIDFDYINDTISDLQTYANQYTDDFQTWKFLLGNENQTKEVADQFKFIFYPDNHTQQVDLSHGAGEVEEPWIHMMMTYMLDRTGTVRKYIQGTNWNYDTIMDSIEFLQSEDWTISKRPV